MAVNVLIVQELRTERPGEIFSKFLRNRNPGAVISYSLPNILRFS